MSIYLVPLELSAVVQVQADSVDEAVELVENKSKYESIFLMTQQGEFKVGYGIIKRAYVGLDGELQDFK